MRKNLNSHHDKFVKFQQVNLSADQPRFCSSWEGVTRVATTMGRCPLQMEIKTSLEVPLIYLFPLWISV
jgi:hypothetical protein